MLLAALALSPRPADAWQLRVGSNVHSPGGDVAIDSRGDVVGSTEHRVGRKRFPEIVKLSAARGRRQWRRRFDDADRGYVQAVLTTPGDDVVAAGRFGPYGTGFTIVRLAAADGTVVWRHDVPATSRHDRFADMTLDPTGDVIVGAAIGDRIVVLALRGTDGTERWRSSTAPIGQYEGANDVAIAPDGDVVVAGDTTAPGAVLARLDGGTGATRWIRTFPNLGNPRGLAIDGDGTIVFGAHFAVGLGLFNPTSRFTVVLLGASGDPIWERRIEPADGTSVGDYVAAATFLPDGDVAATGSVDDRVVTVRLARATGDVVWRHDLDAEPGLLARTPAGDLLVGADVFDGRTCRDFVLLDLSATTGTERGRRRMRGRAENDRSGCSSGVNDDGLVGLAVSDLGVAIGARVGDTRGPRRLIARFPLTR